MGKERQTIDNFNGIIVASHKGWADFFIQSAMAFPSCICRLAVALVMPLGALSAYLGGNLLFFRRSSPSKNQNIEELNQKMQKTGERYKNCVDSINPRLLIFPEGHRKAERVIQRIRTGTFRIAYQQKIPVMILPCEGSQNIVREKKMFIHSADVNIDPEALPNNIIEGVGCNDNKRLRGVCVLNCKEIVDPTKFKNWEDFYAECDKLFREGYDEVCGMYDQITKDTTAAILE
eukprot:MONOS_3026.1-p1 / transcript=MONOS_3026.1 / gene=MONOS_3026 / organism=Monocercomonoides_exilis_PA203 / gene_product=unspecified product / transcript_product=unspecified product / location=Mono_scaffold00067:56350-57257(-) / protein_length=232 / sequence_SO=supercontig / SO=protein_coding / is_pseudo=false